MTLVIRKTLLATALLTAPFAYSAKLAIVIDDLGYHAKEDAQILAMPKTVSVAIIPAAPFAKQRINRRSNKGVIFSFICPWKRSLK